MSPIATRSLTSGRSQCWKVKFLCTTLKKLYRKTHSVYFVEICTVDVKSIVINQVETINFGVTAIVTQCIFLLFSVTGLQANRLPLT